MATIAIVDEKTERRARIAEIVRSGGHEGLELTGPDQAFEALLALRPDVAVVAGVAVLARLRPVLDRTPVVLVASTANATSTLRPDAVIDASVERDELLLCCERLLTQCDADTRRVSLALPRDEQGRVFGRFREGRVIGQGSHGLVREALDTKSGRCVALKVLSPFADREQRARFAREVAALRETHDLAAPAFVDAGEDAGRCWLAMEHIDGPTLRAHVEGEGPCAAVDVLGLLRGLARGLAALDHAGHLHRDIKPSNVVLRSARLDQPVLVDLGLARGRYDPRLTPGELLVGTPGYVAPEIILGSKADIRSDLFGVGLVGRYALTGEEPFPGLHGLALLDAMTQRPVSIPPDSGRLGAVLRWLTALNPAHRPQSPRELLHALHL